MIAGVVQQVLVWPKCGHDRTPENTACQSKSWPRGQCRTCWRVACDRYSKSPKGLVTAARYRRSEKARARRRRYYVRHRQELSIKAAARYLANRDARKAEALAYYYANRAAILARLREQHALKKNAPGAVPGAITT